MDDVPAATADDAPATDLEHVQAEESEEALETIVLRMVTEQGDGDAAQSKRKAAPAKRKAKERDDSVGDAKWRNQKYRDAWQTVPELKDWLQPVDDDPYTAWCRHCQCGLTCHLKNLMLHAKSNKHQRRRQKQRSRSPPPPGERRGYGRDLTRQRPRALSGTRQRASPSTSLSPERHVSGSGHGYKQYTPDVSYGDTDRVNYSIGLHNHTVGFIGAGGIAKATLKGMLDKGIVTPGSVIASAPTSRNLDSWRLWGCSTTRDNAEVMQESDLVFVVVKPQVAEEVFAGVGAALSADDRERCIISLVTGWSLQRISQTITGALSQDARQTPVHVVRCVPNLPVSIGEGSTVYSCADELPGTWLLAVETVFSALGACQRVEESLLDAYSGAFSSGTAFVLSFIESLAAGAVHLGVPWHDAQRMAAKTAVGAAQLVLDSGGSVASLQRAASAAGGSTLAGTMALQKAGFGFAVMSAVQAAAERCGQLGTTRPPAAD